VTALTTAIDARRGPLRAELAEVWRYRELLGFLAWRDIRVRYAQTFIGAAWALIEPFVSVVAFTLVFNRVAGLESGAIPYPLYCFAAMLLWMFFARALRDITTSFVTNASVLRKIYFPRLVLPTAVLLATTVDFACAFVMYFVLLGYYGVAPSWNLLTLPLWVFLAGVSALGVGLMLSAINVRFRDVSQALPFLIQTWMLATPVAYPLHAIPDAWMSVYRLNPMVGAVEGMRWALLPGQTLDLTLLIPSVCVGGAMLTGGLLFFTRTQRAFADVV
jgi:lipopolysaccharide transport system permease protein